MWIDGRLTSSSNDFLKIVDLQLRVSEAAATKTADEEEGSHDKVSSVIVVVYSGALDGRRSSVIVC